jgi:hypothetical protein
MISNNPTATVNFNNLIQKWSCLVVTILRNSKNNSSKLNKIIVLENKVPTKNLRGTHKIVMINSFVIAMGINKLFSSFQII